MQLSNYKVNFSGVQQNKRTQSYINEIVRSIAPRVPAGSSFVLNISDCRENVKADFTIISTTVRFESTQKSDTAMSVMDLISKDINQQIEFWIQKRVV